MEREALIIKRFTEEWDNYKKNSGYTSIDEILEYELIPKYGKYCYQREYISRFKNGKKKLHDKDFEIFSELFSIRKEYLSGEDNYRTEKELNTYNEIRKRLYISFHQLLLCLGYTDGEFLDTDYNATFPENTKAWLESVQENFKMEHKIPLCNLYEDSYVEISDDTYAQLLKEFEEFILFKLNKVFEPEKTQDIPQLKSTYNTNLRKANIEFSSKDKHGTLQKFYYREYYVPNIFLSEEKNIIQQGVNWAKNIHNKYE